MGLHQDKDEDASTLEAGVPVVSLSLGHTARFVLGGIPPPRADGGGGARLGRRVRDGRAEPAPLPRRGPHPGGDGAGRAGARRPDQPDVPAVRARRLPRARWESARARRRASPALRRRLVARSTGAHVPRGRLLAPRGDAGAGQGRCRPRAVHRTWRPFTPALRPLRGIRWRPHGASGYSVSAHGFQEGPPARIARPASDAALDARRNRHAQADQVRREGVVAGRERGLVLLRPLQPADRAALVHAELVGQAAPEVAREGQAAARLAPRDRLALPDLRPRGAAGDPRRQEGLPDPAQREGRRDQGPDHRAGRSDRDGQGVPDPRALRGRHGDRHGVLPAPGGRVPGQRHARPQRREAPQPRQQHHQVRAGVRADDRPDEPLQHDVRPVLHGREPGRVRPRARLGRHQDAARQRDLDQAEAADVGAVLGRRADHLAVLPRRRALRPRGRLQQRAGGHQRHRVRQERRTSRAPRPTPACATPTCSSTASGMPRTRTGWSATCSTSSCGPSRTCTRRASTSCRSSPSSTASTTSRSAASCSSRSTTRRPSASSRSSRSRSPAATRRSPTTAGRRSATRCRTSRTT